MSRRLLALLSCLLAFAMVAAACGDDDDDDGTAADGGDGTAETTTTAGDTATGDTEAPDDTTTTVVTDTTEAGGGEATGDAFANYDDPRGGIFSDFATSFVRDDPFSSLDEFCVPHDPAAELTESDDGITAESIKLVHLRSRLEQLSRHRLRRAGR